MKTTKVALFSLLLTANSLGFAAMASNELDQKMANAMKPRAELPTILVRKNADNTFSKAIDTLGACNAKTKVCDENIVKKLEFTPLANKVKYSSDAKVLASNELNQDSGAAAGRGESWFFWGVGWGWGGWGSVWAGGWGGWATAYSPYWWGGGCAAYYPRYWWW